MFKRKPKPYHPGPLVTARRLVFGVVAAVGVLSHAALGVWAWDRPIMTVADDGPGKKQPLNVKRAPSEDYAAVPVGRAEDEGSEPSAVELSQALVNSRRALPIADPVELDVELRPLNEFEDAGEGALEIELTPFVLGADDIASREAAAPGELEFKDGDGNGGDGGPGGKGTGPGSATIAEQTLKDTAAAPVRIDTTTGDKPIVDRPELDGPSGVSDVRPDTNPSLDAPELDFVDLGLSDTTKIDVPENLDKDFAYRVTRYDPEKGDGYFRVDITAQGTLKTKLKAMPKDVTFLVDTSASISKTWVKEIGKGVGESLARLNKGDRFNIVLFNDKVSLLSEKGPVAANKNNIEAAKGFLNNAASVGYTDVNAAMSGLLKRDVDRSRVYNLVLISDGRPTRGIKDTRNLINLITKDNDLVASIYCVGVGGKQSKELLDFLSYRNKGYSVYADRSDRASFMIQKLMSDLRYPLITDVQLDVVGIDDKNLFPADINDIHQGQTIRVFGRFEKAGPFTMRLTGRSGGKQVAFTFKQDLRDADNGGKTVSLGWASSKLHDLYALVIREGEKKPLLDQIKTISKKYDIKSLY